MYDKILVATDGSSNAHLAVQNTAELARLAGASEVIVLHICPVCTADVDTKDLNREIAEKLVHDAADVIAETGVPARTMVEERAYEVIGSSIVEVAAREDANLIVIGSRGLSEVKGLLLGSVSSKVVQRAHCPVLVIKE